MAEDRRMTEDEAELRAAIEAILNSPSFSEFHSRQGSAAAPDLQVS
jgi:hypothetical protein